MQKYARYGPPDRYDEHPGAGMCLSAFAIVRRKKDHAFLIGMPRDVKRWREEWLYSKNGNLGEENYEQWRLPSCYLREGEHPEQALGRIMKEQLGINKYRVSDGPKVLSYYSRSDWYKGMNHWDVVFQYGVEISQISPPKDTEKWWREMRFFKKGDKELKSKDFGWNSDMMQDLGLIT